ncbi:MAG: hypothetical protein WBL61_06935 [Bryobacteraceae bacterium]
MPSARRFSWAALNASASIQSPVPAAPSFARQLDKLSISSVSVQYSYPASVTASPWMFSSPVNAPLGGRFCCRRSNPRRSASADSAVVSSE